MMYWLETVALAKRQEVEMEVAELKMLQFGEKTREPRLRLYGHVRRKDDMYIGRRMPRMELPGKRKREGQKGRLWMR